MHVYVVKAGNDHEVDEDLVGVYENRVAAFDAASDHHPDDISLQEKSDGEEWFAIWTPSELAHAQTAYVDVIRTEVED